jgi:V/A-type H+-transporting ATPase subunit E
MMKTLDQGKDKVATICEALRREALEPAQKEAKQIIEEAQKQAEELARTAEKDARAIIESGRKELEQEKRVFQSNLEQAGKQALESLRQDVENKLFNSELGSWLSSQSAKPEAAGKLIDAVVEALNKEGLSADLTALIPKSLNAEEVNKELGASVLKKLTGESVQVGSFSGGAQVRLEGKKITIDISDEALKEMLAAYVRKDFRKHLFVEGNGG